MSLKVPILDDLTFDQLIEEAIKRIPQYAPEWTDYNLHDPGITFIELLAWLVEMQIFHLDQITEKHYEKFLRLLGNERQQRETLEETIMKIRKDLKKPCRATTFDDFEYLAKEIKEVARAKAIWNNDRVQVIIVPQEKAALNEELKRDVLLHLNKYRLLTTRIEIVYPEFVVVNVKATVKIKPLSLAIEVKKNVIKALTEFLDPRKGYDGSGWPFGRNLYESEVTSKIENVVGVECVQNLVLSGIGNVALKNGNLKLSENALVRSGEHHIQIEGE